MPNNGRNAQVDRQSGFDAGQGYVQNPLHVRGKNHSKADAPPLPTARMQRRSDRQNDPLERGTHEEQIDLLQKLSEIQNNGLVRPECQNDQNECVQFVPLAEQRRGPTGRHVPVQVHPKTDTQI